MDFLRVGDGRQNGRTSRRKKRRSHHQQGAEQVQHPDAVRCHGENKAKRHQRANQVARDHNLFAVQPIEHHARDRAHGDRGDGSRQQNARDHQAGMRKRHGQRKNGNVIEIVANFANNLPHPGVAIISIFAEKLEKLVHQPATFPEAYAG